MFARHAAACFALLALSSCSCEPTGYEQKTYACSTNDDCVAPHVCLGGVCRSPGATGGGAAQGGGAGGAGGGATGGGAADAGTCADRAEVCGDDVDQNCNGILDDGCDCSADRPCYPNADGVFSPRQDSPQLRYPWDGGAGCAAGLQRCVNNTLAQTCVDVHAPGVENCDGKDTDCDGVIDPTTCPCQNGRECYPGTPNTNGVGACRAGTWDCAQPVGAQCVGVDIGGVETCNGVDDDCNGLVDDNLPATAACAPGVCSSQFKTCGDGGVLAACTLSAIPGYSPTEVCGDQQDNDCNGQVDDGCVCTPNAVEPCFTGPASACDGGACFGLCRKGTQTCGALGDGGVGYGACTNQVLPVSEVCSDGLDNDCDNAVDCADSQCSNRACGGGKTCSSGTCQCIFDGGVSTVELCSDGVDNTCNGLIDCAESSCAGQSCGANGKRCVGTSCSCVLDGGTAETTESTCNDGRDNDCDGLVDCADSTCAGRACGTNKTCAQSVCTCLSDGGVPQATETLCSDGADNDCDGLTDCADPNCAMACTTMVENCKDGIDNDGDMAIDCADSDCQHKGCSATNGASVCCGTSCKDLANDPTNCGQCGTVCSSGACSPSTVSGHQSGRCTCPTGLSTACPQTGPTRQTCSANVCTCGDDNDRCVPASGGQCSVTTCFYP